TVSAEAPSRHSSQCSSYSSDAPSASRWPAPAAGDWPPSLARHAASSAGLKQQHDAKQSSALVQPQAWTSHGYGSPPPPSARRTAAGVGAMPRVARVTTAASPSEMRACHRRITNDRRIPVKIDTKVDYYSAASTPPRARHRTSHIGPQN